LVGVHKVNRHGIAFAVDLLLAWPVKVELLERVLLAADGYRTSGGVIDHDRVAVIDNVQRGWLVIELDGRQVSLLWIPDIDGGLVVTILARSELRL
jgi:hypothetical protein